MHNPPLMQCFFFAGLALQVALCAVLAARRLLKRWPSLFAYCLLATATDAAISFSRHSYTRYFYLYWGWSFVSALLQLWILNDVIRSFPGIEIVGQRIRAAVCGFGACVSIASIIITMRDRDTFAGTVIHCAVMTHRAVSIGGGVFLVVILISTWVLRLRWQQCGAEVARGLLLLTAAQTIFTYLLSYSSRESRQHAAYLLAASTVASLALWMWSFATYKEETYIHPTPSI